MQDKNISDSLIQMPRRTPFNNNNQTYMDLYDYLKLAQISIKKFAHPGIRGRMLNSEDAISFVAEKLMESDHDYNKNISKLVTNRCNRAKFAIKTWTEANLKKPKLFHLTDTLSAKDDTKDKELLEKLLYDLPPKQKQYIQMHFFDGIRMIDMAAMLGISKQGVSDAILRGLKNMEAAFEKIR